MDGEYWSWRQLLFWLELAAKPTSCSPLPPNQLSLELYTLHRPQTSNLVNTPHPYGVEKCDHSNWWFISSFVLHCWSYPVGTFHIFLLFFRVASLSSCPRAHSASVSAIASFLQDTFFSSGIIKSNNNKSNVHKGIQPKCFLSQMVVLKRNIQVHCNIWLGVGMDLLGVGLSLIEGSVKV